MKRPSEPNYEAKGAFAKKIAEDLKTPATEELEVIRKVLAARKKKKRDK